MRCTVGLVSLAEPLNTLAAQRWRSFATQNYFDKRGVFASVLFCGPLLLIAFVILVMLLLSVADMLVSVKRAELRRSSHGTAADATVSDERCKGSTDKGQKQQ